MKYALKICCVLLSALFLLSLGILPSTATEEAPAYAYADGVFLALTSRGYVVTGVADDALEGGELIIPQEYAGVLVTFIDEEAFVNNDTITRVVIPGSVRTIGRWSFNNCTRLEEVVIEQGVQTIGFGAFVACPALKKINIPKSVKTIEGHMLGYCPELAQVDVEEGNPRYGVINECLVDLETKTLLYFLTETATIPDDGRVISIGMCAGTAAGGQRMKELTVPASVKTLEDTPFGNMQMLKKVVFEGEIDHVRVYTFQNCTALEEIVFPKKVKTLEFRSIEDCIGLKRIVLPQIIEDKLEFSRIGGVSIEEMIFPEGWQYAGFETMTVKDHMIISDQKLLFAWGDVVLPDDGSITTIGARSCSAARIGGELILPECITVIEEYAFSQNASLEKVTLGKSIQNLGTGAFSHCKNLREVQIDTPHTTWGMNVFNGCSGLEKVTLQPGLESIAHGTFYGCKALKEIDLPQSVKTVGQSAFRGCGLEELTLKEGVRVLERNAFSSTALKSISLPEGLVEIEESCFGYCKDLKEVSLPSTLSSIGKSAFLGCTSLEEVVLPEGLKTLGVGVFGGCTCLKKVVFFGKLETLPGSTFSDCPTLTDVVLAEGLKHIEKKAFVNCPSLERLEFPLSLQTVSGGAFEGCTALNTFVLPKGSALRWVNGCLLSGTVLVRGTKGCSLPELGYAEIGAYAFEGSDIEEVCLPVNFRIMREYAFKDCKKLRKITFPADCLPGSLSSTVTVETWFTGCASLEEIRITGDKRWYSDEDGLALIDQRFDRVLVGTTSGYIPDDGIVNEIGRRAFAGRRLPERLEIPANITWILPSAFAGALNVEEIVVKSDRLSIDSNAFSNMPDLRRLKSESTNDAPQSVSLRYDAFTGSEGLEELWLPQSTGFSDKVLVGFDGLTVYYRGTEDQWHQIVKGRLDKGEVVFLVEDTPRTGDGTPLLFLAAGASGLLALALLVLQKRKKKVL